MSGRLMMMGSVWLALAGPVVADDEHPLSAARRAEITAELDRSIARLTAALDDDPANVNLWSRRGDAHFFRGDFDRAVRDYEQMVELSPRLEASHWRRGIAYFYAGRYWQAARQFEIYHTHDDVDRENGIWRFYSQAKAHDLDTARRGLLRYRKDDREPFPAVYKLFTNDITPEAVLQQVEAAEIDPDERDKRRFYAHLYIGLNHALEDRPDAARRHLREAVANPWGPKAGYGPNFMWHVGRLHYERLLADEARDDAVPAETHPSSQ